MSHGAGIGLGEVSGECAYLEFCSTGDAPCFLVKGDKFQVKASCSLVFTREEKRTGVAPTIPNFKSPSSPSTSGV